MDKPDRGDPQAMDLGELLTVLQAADWTGLSVTTIRRRMEDGELRFEVLRDKGRDVQRIRWVDLCDLYPHVLGGSESLQAEEGNPARDPEPRHQPPEPDPVPTTQAADMPAPASTGGERSLQLSLQSLTEQRDDLREQCYDLRIRLSSAEKERQAAVGALLHAQKQFLTVEGSSYPHAPGPLWRRPVVWSLVAGAGIVLWIIGGMLKKQEQAIQQGQSEWAQTLSAETQERLRFQTQRLDSERRAMQDQLVRMNTLTEEERQAMRAKLAQDQTDRTQLHQKLDSLERNAEESQGLVRTQLEAEKQLRERWSQEQLELTTAQWAALREDSIGLLRSELAAERTRNQQQQEALAASWRQREQKALLESDRLAQQVGALLDRVENGPLFQEAPANLPPPSEAKNAAYARNPYQDVGRFLGRWAAHWGLQMATFRP